MNDDREITAKKAEEITGKRLDRRRSYALIDGEVFELSKWVDTCSGCFDPGENMGHADDYPYDPVLRIFIGAGCHECGYTGKRRHVVWVPESS